MNTRAAFTILSLIALLTGCTPSPRDTLDSQPAPIHALVTTTPVLRTGDALHQRHENIIADVAAGGHNIAFLGASIIEGWTTTGKEQWTAVWLPRHAVNCGIGGDRTQHVLARLDDRLLDALAAPNNDIRWVVMNIGANNTDTDSGPDIAAGVQAIIARLRSRLPHARIVLCIFPRGQHPNPLRDKLAAAHALLAPYYAAHAPEHVRIIDMGTYFLTPAGDIPAALMPDFLHPSPAGYQLWSNELENIVM